MLGNLIGGFIVIVVGVALLPVIAEQVLLVRDNVTGATQTILDLVPLFYVLGILSAGIAIAAQGLRAAGLMNM